MDDKTRLWQFCSFAHLCAYVQLEFIQNVTPGKVSLQPQERISIHPTPFCVSECLWRP